MTEAEIYSDIFKMLAEGKDDLEIRKELQARYPDLGAKIIRGTKGEPGLLELATKGYNAARPLLINLMHLEASEVRFIRNLTDGLEMCNEVQPDKLREILGWIRALKGNAANPREAMARDRALEDAVNFLDDDEVTKRAAEIWPSKFGDEEAE